MMSDFHFENLKLKDYGGMNNMTFLTSTVNNYDQPNYKGINPVVDLKTLKNYSPRVDFYINKFSEQFKDFSKFDINNVYTIMNENPKLTKTCLRLLSSGLSIEESKSLIEVKGVDIASSLARTLISRPREERRELFDNYIIDFYNDHYLNDDSPSGYQFSRDLLLQTHQKLNGNIEKTLKVLDNVYMGIGSFEDLIPIVSNGVFSYSNTSNPFNPSKKDLTPELDQSLINEQNFDIKNIKDYLVSTYDDKSEDLDLNNIFDMLGADISFFNEFSGFSVLTEDDIKHSKKTGGLSNVKKSLKEIINTENVNPILKKKASATLFLLDCGC